MTDEQLQAYLRDSYRCPFCQSRDLIGDSYDQEGDTITQTVTCQGCGKSWQDEYRLADAYEIEE